jgi:polyhydroxybutyrate depolymerase
MIAHRGSTAAALVLLVLGGACSSESTDAEGTGAAGSAEAGGASGTGGQHSPGGTIATGGDIASGGQPSGGVNATGGAVASGGQPSGGANAAGGVVASGGRVGTGGRVGVGGRDASGGSVGAGGSSPATGGSLGTGGSVATGGDTSTGGTGAGGADGASPGCSGGKTTSPCGKSGGTKCTLTSNSKTREYYLILPSNYDSAKPYPVVVELHGMIATAEMALSWFKDIPTNMPDAIYIAPQGLKHAEQGGGANGKEVTGWANVDGEDIQFMKDLVSATGKDYCVDSARVFAVGFSYGGMFSYAIGCELGGLFRAIAPMSGALLSGCNLSGKPVAMWGSHGTNDSMVPIASGRQARDKILQQNHCGTETQPVDPSPCVAYQGCDEGYPVTWCEWDGDHDRPPFGSSAVAAFFKQF